ncbi:trimeric intracellular cation channel family protein [Demequina sediminicola]|uniref:trimeric intracellular cation channel family protein n=1 Tax=Demequina sediminicola TaxID=1095026 RepID=UPI000780F33C|nr:TRIC cation channel family protein [Demequina sediminicola]
MTELPVVLDIPLAINLAAVFVGALVGTVRAGEDPKVDVVGMFTLAAVLGFGGGLVRDILLGNLPPAAFRDARYLIAAMVATLIGAVALYYVARIQRLLWSLDTLAIGLFACVGANAALIAGLGLLPSALIGACASIGGVVLADILQGKPSSIVHVGPPNAIAGFGGAVTYTALYSVIDDPWVTIMAVLVTLGLRLTGPILNLTIPQPRRRAYELRRRRDEDRRKLRRAERNPRNRNA